MDIGIGLPNAVPGTARPQLLEWARRADAAGLCTLASIGAVSYPSYEELTVFAAAGAGTERIRLLSNVLIAPARSAAELAKQAATVDQPTGGRLTLGLGSGWRAADFALTDRDFDGRGAAIDQLLGDPSRALAREGPRTGHPSRGAPAGPVADPCDDRRDDECGGAPGGRARRRLDRRGDATGCRRGLRRTGPHGVARGRPRRCAAHQRARVLRVGDTEQQSRDALLDYYAAAGPETAGMVADSALRSPDAIRVAVEASRAAGVDEICLDATVPDPDQVDLLADVVLG